MSDSASPREVDQVLSSIRRLVSDEAAETRPAPGPTRPDRLLLTPALRVPAPAARPAPGDAAGHGTVRARDMAPDGAGGTPPASATAPDEAGTLEQRIAELEAAVAGCDDDWEPDGAESLAAVTGWAAPPPASSPAPPSEGAAKPDDAAPSPMPPVAEAGPQAKADAPDHEADQLVFDEEMLRELVAEIVREELQGRLGERITLNVRKLVRREINRALAMRDLE
ncbi:hypothetical protein [Rhodovulum marinum]|uniref:Uncharacterized protein n=1 Tax=Rhodovulum marinum TaxID=320662 RepID=A0A4R2QAZ4_9RHOB|nr:hypothetical protein [Rhodovulum marinum]TCP44071.1 hypothetical protein EV662_101157 [Rhodovulum marinum]